MSETTRQVRLAGFFMEAGEGIDLRNCWKSAAAQGESTLRVEGI